MWILMLTIWNLLLLIAAIYIVRVILLARYVKQQMNDNLDTMSYISDVINSTLSPGGVNDEMYEQFSNVVLGAHLMEQCDVSADALNPLFIDHHHYRNEYRGKL